MVTCSYCQTENPDDAQLCRECARALPREVAAGVTTSDPSGSEAPTNCPSCGRPAPAHAEFCPNCGSSLASAQYAGFWRRFGGFVVDWVILAVAGGIIGAFLGQRLPLALAC